MVREKDIDKLYNAYNAIKARRTTANESYALFESATRSDDKQTRQAALNMLFDHFEQFDNQDSVQERIYSMLSDRERDVRRLIINSLPKLLRHGENVTPVCNVLAQLLTIPNRRDLILVKNILGQILSSYPGQCFNAMHECAIESSTSDEKLKIAEYLEEHLPRSCRGLDHIVFTFEKLYINIIESIERLEDVSLLIDCIRSNEHIRYATIINTFSKRVEVSNVCAAPFIDYIGSIRKYSAFHLNSLDSTLARMSFVVAVLNRSNIHTFEGHYKHFLDSSFMKCCEMREVATRMVNAMMEEGFRRSEEPDQLVFRLAQVYILTTSIQSNRIRTTVAKWMRRNVDIVRNWERQDRRNFLVLMASFTAKTSFRVRNDAALTAILQFFIEVLPPDNFQGPSMHFERYDLEAACFLLKNVVKRSQTTFDKLESLEPNWIERTSTLMEMLRQSTQVINEELRETEPSEYRNKLAVRLHTFNQSGICIFLFFGNKFKESLQVYPTWTSENSVFNGTQITNALTQTLEIEAVLDDVKRKSRPPILGRYQ